MVAKLTILADLAFLPARYAHSDLLIRKSPQFLNVMYFLSIKLNNERLKGSRSGFESCAAKFVIITMIM